MKREEFDAYKEYVGLKLHFNEWDFIWRPDHEYRMGSDAWNKRRDKAFFTRLSVIKPKRPDRIEFLVSAFMRNRNTWIGEIFDEEIEESHRVRMSHRRAIMYNFRVDCDNIQDHLQSQNMRLIDLLKVGTSQPRIFEGRVDGGVTEETLSILDHFFSFTKQSTNNLLWEENRLKLHKYKYTLGLQEFTNDLKSHIDTLLAINSASRT